MTKSDFIVQVNTWGAEGRPFLFIIDFEFEKPEAHLLSDIDPAVILFNIDGFTNESGAKGSVHVQPRILEKNPPSFESYRNQFNIVYDHLTYGDSYLTNLTTRTEVQLSHSFKEVYQASNARYKLFYNGEFLVFSPECFVQIQDGKIFSYPMKGTIDAAIPGAKEKIISDQKELAEHVTIVDLIRNDLSQVASAVCVNRFRYVEELKTNHKNLLQVSSEISGTLSAGFKNHLGNLLSALLPAGSISGAPKPKTVSIIQEAENEKRGFYTGVFGYFDGQRLNSGVMIRFVELDNGKTFYRSGGGITTQSIAEKEYQELINKVYVPVD
jgi:para-aminobenzoate synthetase component I